MPRRLTEFPKTLSSYALDDADLSRLGAGRWEYEDGEYLIREGERDEDLFVLEQGCIVVEKEGGADARPLILHATLYQEGQFIAFGEMAHYVGGVRTASVRSSGRSIVLRFPPSSFGLIFERFPPIAERLFRSLGEHLRRTTEELRALQARLHVPCERRSGAPGEVLFLPGEPADRLFQVLSGEVRLRALPREERVGPGGPSQGFVELGPYLAGERHAAEASCGSPCLLLVFGPRERAKVIRSFPEESLRALAQGRARGGLPESAAL